MLNQTNTSAAVKVSRRLSFIIPILMLTSDAAVIYQKFYSLQYTSDGLHYYSFLRNISNFSSLYEGPSMEWLLGVHSYFSLVLVTPMIGIFNSPLVLALLNPIIYLTSSIVLYKVCLSLKLSEFKSLLMSLIFLTTPLLSEARLGIPPYMFQPDIIAIPLVFAIYLAVIKQKTLLYVSAFILLLLTKEEWILFSLFIIFLISLFDQSHRLYIREHYRILFFGWTACSIVSISTRLYFSNMNDFSHAPIGKIAKDPVKLLHASTSAFGYSLNRWWPYLMFGAILVFLTKDKARALAILLFTFLMILFRYSLNVVIYGDARPISGAELWSTHAFVTPLVVLMLIQLAAMSNQRYNFPIVSLLIFGFLLILFPHESSSSNTRAGFSGIFSAEHYASIDRYKCLQSKVDETFASNEGSYFISSEFLMAPAMARSHVSLPWAQAQSQSESIINNSSGILLYTVDITDELRFDLHAAGFGEVQHSCGQEFTLLSR